MYVAVDSCITYYVTNSDFFPLSSTWKKAIDVFIIRQFSITCANNSFCSSLLFIFWRLIEQSSLPSNHFGVVPSSSPSLHLLKLHLYSLHSKMLINHEHISCRFHKVLQLIIECFQFVWSNKHFFLNETSQFYNTIGYTTWAWTKRVSRNIPFLPKKKLKEKNNGNFTLQLSFIPLF